MRSGSARRWGWDRLVAAAALSALSCLTGAGPGVVPASGEDSVSSRTVHTSAMTSGATPAVKTSTAQRVRLPPIDAKADYQLGGAYPPPPGVRIVSRDRTAAPPMARYAVCYVNGFQTQPGSLPWWRAHHPRLLLRDRSDAVVRDRGWPDEVLLDTSTRARRHTLANIVGGWMRQCARNGFAAVEPDNLDSYTRSHRLLERSDNLAAARLFSVQAHDAGLAVAQKNLADLTRRQRLSIGFDFAVAEECGVYAECGGYRAAYGRRVIEIEYSDNGRRYFARACRHHGGAWSIVYRDRDLVTPSNPRYVYAAC